MLRWAVVAAVVRMNGSAHYQVERYRVARTLRESGCRRIGVAACGDGVDVDAVARRLAQALCEAEDGAVAVLTAESRAGALAQQLAHLDEIYSHVLVPLGPLRRRGEELRACDLLDGVVLLVRRGGAREGELLARRRELGATHFLGVILLD